MLENDEYFGNPAAIELLRGHTTDILLFSYQHRLHKIVRVMWSSQPDLKSTLVILAWNYNPGPFILRGGLCSAVGRTKNGDDDDDDGKRQL